jgi:hypothetical protein
MAELLSINHTIGSRCRSTEPHHTQVAPSLGGFSVVALREIDCFLQDILLTWNSILEAKNFHAFFIFFGAYFLSFTCKTFLTHKCHQLG